MRRRTLWTSLAALALVAAPAAARADDKDSSGGELRPDDLVGVYTIDSGEREGVTEPAERVKGTMVRFSKDRVVVVDTQNKELYGASYKLDPRHKPAKITLTSKLGQNEGAVAHGLISKDGDKVKLVYALPGGDPPTSFKTKEKQLMFEMTYQKK